MSSPVVIFRLPPPLYSACEELAEIEGLSIGRWFQNLAAIETGLPCKPLRGLNAVSAKRRKQIARSGGLAKGKRKG